MAAIIKEDRLYNGWEDVYRNKWVWDEVYHGSHCVDCYPGCCPMRVYVKDGIVWREEQQGMYGPSGEDVPDYGPRGCQKGLRHAKYMYGPQRILYPMKRVGERGSGRWERVSWEEATQAIADKFLDLATTAGPECISYGSGTRHGPAAIVEASQQVELYDREFDREPALEYGDEAHGFRESVPRGSVP